jgi:RNA polymerase sigma-70 factor (ECF subfamily)
VEDLVQDTLAIAWTRRAEFDGARALGPWLRGIAVRVVMGSVRREARRRRIAMDDAHEIVRIEGLAERFAAIEDQLDGRQLAEGVRGCVQALPATFREVLERHYGGDQSIAEIAVDLGISDDLASKRAIRGRALVARCLRSKGLVPGSDAPDGRDEESS